uniref:CUB domain-containing protein n=1 Tax=Panagrolaimus sp. JU765 TaxID=591449 RepID=A0AC34R1Z7_9BILA
DISPPPNLIYIGQTCSYDSLKVVLNPVAPNETKEFCGHVMPPSLLTTSDELTLILKSDTSMAHGGYELSYFTAIQPKIIKEKGVNMTIYNFAPNHEKSGAITPIGYPQNYPNNTLQKFVIAPPPGLLCKFTIILLRTSLDVDKRNCSDADYLAYGTGKTETQRPDKMIGDVDLTILPCVADSTSPENDIPATRGQTYIFGFVSDANDDNNGLGFRIHWDCNDYEEEIL